MGNIITVRTKDELKDAASVKYEKIFLSGEAEEALLSVVKKTRNKRKVSGATGFASFLASAAFPPFMIVTLGSLLFGASTNALSKYNIKMTSDNKYYLERK